MHSAFSAHHTVNLTVKYKLVNFAGKVSKAIAVNDKIPAPTLHFQEGDYYSPRFPLQPSLVKFVHDYRKASKEERKKIVDDYKMMQQMRMSIYDISDVAYDAFLLNGQPKRCLGQLLLKLAMLCVYVLLVRVVAPFFVSKYLELLCRWCM